jgi:uncharacterized protein
MPDRTLNVSPDLALPLDAVTETFLIFGKKGSGKTATAGVLAEEMIGAGLPVAVLDPMGAWWGLRSSADGEGAGLPVVIIGGEHGDLPLTPESGAQVADLITEERVPVVADLFLMSKTQQRHFVTDFMERLFHRSREPLHLIIDEADRWAPQRGTHDMARLLGAYEDIVLRGRRLGLGSTSITLRPAQLHAAIRSQVECLVAMRMLGKLDVQAIDEWVRLHATDEDAATLKASLPSLPTGTAWFWSPGWLELMARVQVRPRWTFDSSATPRVGEQRLAATLADIDLTAITARLSAVIAKSAQDDPKALRRRIAELERQLAGPRPDHAADLRELVAERESSAALRAQLAEALAREPERVEVPVIRPGDAAALDQAITGLRDVAGSLEIALSRAVAQPARATPAVTVPAARLTPPSAPAAAPTALRPAPRPASVEPAGEVRIGKRERAILTVLAQFPAGRTHRQIALLTGYSPKASTIGAGLSTLRKAGYVSPGGNPVLITGEGMQALGDDFEPLPTGPALLDYWNGELGARERALLAVLLDRYPAALSQREMAEATGYSPDASTIGAGMSKLRGLGLADGWAAATDFVEAIHG